jgi:hypothetical protein
MEKHMKAKRDEYGKDDKAVTVAERKSMTVVGSSYGDVCWGVWCAKEMARMNACGDGGKVRIARGDGRMWLTRG